MWRTGQGRGWAVATQLNRTDVAGQRGAAKTEAEPAAGEDPARRDSDLTSRLQAAAAGEAKLVGQNIESSLINVTSPRNVRQKLWKQASLIEDRIVVALSPSFSLSMGRPIPNELRRAPCLS